MLSDGKSARIDLVLPRLRVGSERQLFQSLAYAISPLVGSPPNMVLEELKRTHESSQITIGEGVAVPHGRFPNMRTASAVLVTLEEPMSFDEAPDGRPVDILCIVLSPTEDGPIHLRRLARISRLFHNRELCARIRETTDPEALRNMVMNPEGWTLAA